MSALSTYPTANQSPDGQYPNEKICDVKLCCRNCLAAVKSQALTVLSRPPVHSLVPSGDMSMQDAPSVWPWNCLRKCNEGLLDSFYSLPR